MPIDAARLQQIRQQAEEWFDGMWSDTAKIEFAAEHIRNLLAEVDRLAAQVQDLEVLIRWALGESGNDDFPVLPDDWPRAKFYWRHELRRRFEALSPAPGGGTGA